LGTFLNYSDFVIHRPLEYTRSRLISGIAALAYNGVYAFFLYRLFGLAFTVSVLLVLPHVGFYADRLRQFTEHNLMPLENKSGARSLGIGFWGLLIGGGPWGQPCHLEHHLVPSIPWYQQIILHRYLVRLMSERQRRQFLLRPFVGYPRLFWPVVTNANRFSHTRRVLEVSKYVG
jgi:fatty acid desaturase